jgi:hypothetical protein
MSIHISISSLQFAALRETLAAAEVLLPNPDQKSTLFYEGKRVINTCRFGYSAATLLFTFVEAISTSINKPKKSEGKISFRILKHEIFGSQTLTDKACDDLHTRFRSGLAHHLALPENSFLDYNTESKDVFCTGKSPDIIQTVNLYQLMKVCKEALIKFNTAYGESTPEGPSLSELLKKSQNVILDKNSLICPSGYVKIP